MTANALAFDTPALDRFDNFDGGDGGFPTPTRPELRLIQGGLHGGQHRGLNGAAHRGVLPVSPLASQPSVEVYRRRRFLVLVAVTLMVLGAAWAMGLSVTSFSTAPALADAAPAVHVVLPGDSYAAIAADLGAANPVAAAEQMRVANGGSELIVGQRLVVPSSVLTVTS